jgi:hypothetical protein
VIDIGKNIRRRNRRAVLAALGSALVFGLVAGAAAGLVADGETIATVITTGAVSFGALLAAVLLARSPALWRSVGIPDGFAPGWFSVGLPLLALVLATGLATGTGAVVHALSRAPQTPLWTVPLISAVVVALLPWWAANPRKAVARSAPTPVRIPPPVPVAPKAPPVATRTLTITSPTLQSCPARCGKPILSGEMVCECEGDPPHEVHAECAGLCSNRCPMCGFRLKAPTRR